MVSDLNRAPTDNMVPIGDGTQENLIQAMVMALADP